MKHEKELSRKQFVEWGRQGGRVKTKARANASRANGLKGGRPKKAPTNNRKG